MAKISHDLRNILTSTQLFTDRIESSEDPLVRRMAPKIVNSVARAVSLCESTLAFGRAEEPSPRLTMVRLHELVTDVLDSEVRAVESGCMTVRQDVPATLALRADPEQLFRVLLNLVRNARQAIEASGRTAEIAIAAHEEDTHWQITVADGGPGLPPKAQAHLFTAFQGGARKGGSGRGLVIAAELGRGHGGTLTLQKTGPEGTVFEIRLPKGDGAL